MACRKPRRFGGGKGGEARLPKEPKKASKRLAAGLSLITTPSAAAASAAPPSR